MEYALTQWWRASEGAPAAGPDYDRFAPVERVLAVSGSASALSARQVDAAIAAGFAAIAVDARALGRRRGVAARRLRRSRPTPRGC